jgi:hypothetical protein
MVDTGVSPEKLPTWPTERLVAHRGHLARELQRLQIEKVELLRILDERRRLGAAVDADGDSPTAA